MNNEKGIIIMANARAKTVGVSNILNGILLDVIKFSPTASLCIALHVSS